MLHRKIALFLVAGIATMMSAPLVSAQDFNNLCEDENQAYFDCDSNNCIACLGVGLYDITDDDANICAAFGALCSLYTCCDECAQKGAKAINCVIQRTSVYSTTVCVCQEDGTIVSGAATNTPGSGAATNTPGSGAATNTLGSGAATNTLGVLVMLSIVSLYYVT